MPQPRQLALAAALMAVATAGAVVVSTGQTAPRAVVAAGGITAAGAPAAASIVLPSPSPSPTAVPPAPEAKALVAVSVAEVWAGHRKVRPYDRPALQRPAQVEAWIRGMTFNQRSHLFQRLATQVRYGEQVVVLGTNGALSRIRVPDQTGGRFPDGIVGWMASRQLVVAPTGWGSAARVATVTAKRANLRASGRTLQISYATTLPVIKTLGRRVIVDVPGAARGSLPRGAVSIHAPNAPALRPSAHAVLTQARRFLGLPYLWAGMTSWGYDCSGLTSTIYGMLGITLPRDAADQSLVGRAVSRRQLQPGDLVFFSHTRQRADIHHVAIYAGRGRVLQSPYTGSRVEVTKLRGSYLNREYWGASRPLS
ncbi:MAG: C40 family peptidase [Mycobacteriales bacterium]